ncbi:hypothetical protein CN333_26705, partial [Bacillus thuringiensis]
TRPRDVLKAGVAIIGPLPKMYGHWPVFSSFFFRAGPAAHPRGCGICGNRLRTGRDSRHSPVEEIREAQRCEAVLGAQA